MRLAISGTACQGKTTFINDFLSEWTDYSTPTHTYRDVIAEKNLPHSSITSQETQWAILNHQIDEFQKTSKGDNIIFDRCPLDNLAYSIWASDKEESDVDDEFVKKCIPLIRESLRYLDIIFFTPITKVAPVEVVEDGFRDTDQHTINEVDNIFKALYREYANNPKSEFFLEEDRPAIIEIFGNREERIEMVKLYVDKDGDAVEPQGIITPEEAANIEKLKKAFNV